MTTIVIEITFLLLMAFMLLYCRGLGINIYNMPGGPFQVAVGIFLIGIAIFLLLLFSALVRTEVLR
jgi:hypothetical protein